MRRTWSTGKIFMRQLSCRHLSNYLQSTFLEHPSNHRLICACASEPWATTVLVSSESIDDSRPHILYKPHISHSTDSTQTHVHVQAHKHTYIHTSHTELQHIIQADTQAHKQTCIHIRNRNTHINTHMHAHTHYNNKSKFDNGLLCWWN